MYRTNFNWVNARTKTREIAKTLLKIFEHVENYELMGWDLISLNSSEIQFRMFNSSKNLKIDEKIFNIPKIN